MTELSKVIQPFLQLMNWLLPPSCLLCGAVNQQIICEGCISDLPYHHEYPTCYSCGAVLPKRVTVQILCGRCLQTKPYYTHTQALYCYEFPVNILIHAVKFRDNLGLLRTLAQFMADHYAFDGHPDVLIPIPLHPKRLRERGYNQALELARPISRVSGIPIDTQTCKRIKYTSRQTQLTAQERAKNLKDAFFVEPNAADWQHVVLIDDVVTTGTTVNELAKALYYAGVERIDVYCCARTSH